MLSVRMPAHSRPSDARSLDRAVATALDGAGGDWRAAAPAIARLVAGSKAAGSGPNRHAAACRIRSLRMAWAIARGDADGLTPEEAAHVVASLGNAPSSGPFRDRRWPDGEGWAGDIEHVRPARDRRGAERLVADTTGMGRIAGTDAPVALLLATPEGRLPVRVRMAQAYRPVLLPGSWRPCPSSVLRDIAVDPPAWVDNPFLPAAGNWPGPERGRPLLPLGESVPRGRPRSVDGNAVTWALADIDGIAHRTCAFPLLDFAIVSGQGRFRVAAGWRIPGDIDSESAQDTLGLSPASVSWVGMDALGMAPPFPAAFADAFGDLLRQAGNGLPPLAVPPAEVCRPDLLPEGVDPLRGHVASVVLPALARAGIEVTDLRAAAAGAHALALAAHGTKAEATWSLAHAACASTADAADRDDDLAHLAAVFPGS